MLRFGHFSGGVHPRGNKNTHFYPTVRLDDFKEIHIPMSMHIGPPCTPVVKVGDQVKVGQLIGEASGPMAVPIHSSVSGKVTAIRKEVSSAGRSVEVVLIESDGQSTRDESVVPPVVTDTESLRKALRDSGRVGLGGAGFPSHMKSRSRWKVSGIPRDQCADANLTSRLTSASALCTRTNYRRHQCGIST